jgi:hypothetical protein
MKNKKLPYGEKQVRITALIEQYPHKSDRQIAKIVGCAPSYVHFVRKLKLAPTAPAPEGLIAHVEAPLDLTPEMEETLLRSISSGTGRTDPNRDKITQLLDERGKRYGNFLDSARVAQRLKNVAHQFASDYDKRFDVDQAEALDMIFSKIGRILNGDPNYADNWADIAGYAKLVADRLDGVRR